MSEHYEVVVVGSGGREACLALVLARHHDVVVTPGNPGIPGSVATPPEDLDAGALKEELSDAERRFSESESGSAEWSRALKDKQRAEVFLQIAQG